MSGRSPPLGVMILCGLSVLGVVADLAVDPSGPTIVVSGFNLALAWGLWTGRAWAWYISLALYGVVGALLGLAGFLGLSVPMILAAGLSAVVFAYLYQLDHYYVSGTEPTPSEFDDERLDEIRA